MIIDVTGFGWSGSGAYIDFLSEYKENIHSKAIGHELALLHNVDGIMDLDYKLIHKHCRVMDSDVAIKRFISLVEGYCDKNNEISEKLRSMCEEYVSNLLGVKFMSCSSYDRIYLYNNRKNLRDYYNKVVSTLLSNRVSRTIFGRNYARFFRLYNTNLKYLSYCPENFISSTHQLMSCIFNLLKKGKEGNLITDHLLPPDNPLSCIKYINEDVKCIVVRRDPRDTYILAKEIYKGKIPIPVDTVEDFIWFYKNTIEKTRIENSDIVLSLNFESLIYEYDMTKKQIELFLGISNHICPRKIFQPEISVNNTQLYKRYSNFTNDIRKIEEALPDSLYSFDNFSIRPKFDSETF